MRQAFIYGLFIALVSCFYTSLNLSAQISYGGEPWLQRRVGLRSASVPTVVMPPVDTNALREEANLLRTNRFAYKMKTHIDLKEASVPVELSDGRLVWQVRILSEGALSLNLLFTEYHVPEGATLFIYSSEQVVGQFDHRNNASHGMLPIRPLSGDEITIEYSEPVDVPFEGRVLLGEVNHGFCDLFEGLRAGDEPGVDISSYLCMPDARCGEVDEELIRSTVLLMIDGEISCTGTLINNTADDETPYLLTAMHCLNTAATVSKPWDYYVYQSGTIVAFFNYERTVCGSRMRGVEEMSLAVTTPRVVNEEKDIALLEFEERPPAHYNAYYAGWDMSGDRAQQPYTNLHHPDAAVKRFGLYNASLELTTYPGRGLLFKGSSYWKIASWAEGSTHYGSSGSPLFNRDGLLVGTLTGGASTCYGSLPRGETDYFSATHQGWETNNPANQLKTYLNPIGDDTKVHPGLDPNRDNPLIRLANAAYNHGDELVTDSLLAPDTGLAFGYNSRSLRRFAEAFDVDTTLEVLGTYLYLPRMPYADTRSVTIEVYEGVDSPETLRASVPYRPQYAGYNVADSTWGENPRSTTPYPIESFVRFDNPIRIAREKKLFVGYHLADPTNNNTAFAVYNTWFALPTSRNTAWMKDGDNWLPAHQHTAYGNKTALAVQPLVRYSEGNSIADVEAENRLRFFYDRELQSLLFYEPIDSDGHISLYSIGGELIGTVPFRSGDKQVRLPSRSSNTLGIVRVTTRDECVSGRVIY